MKTKARCVSTALLLTALVALLAACAAKQQDAPAPAPVSEPERVPYAPMDIFSEEFCPCGADWSGNFTVFEASFDKSATEGKSRFVLSMTGSGNMFACVAYQADIAGLSEDEKNARINEYLEGGYCHIDGKDGRWVDIRRADPNDDRYAYVEADGQHGQNGAGCVIDISYSVEGMDESYIGKYMQLVRDNYSLDALAAVADYMDVGTDFAECGIYANQHKNEVKTSVVYNVPDVEAVRKKIAENLKSDWWEWNGNQETWIQYDDQTGNKLIFDAAGGAVTISQESKLYGPDFAEGSLAALGFAFDDAGTCGVFELREPHYVSIAIHRPEWGAFDGDWNIEYMDTDVNGYNLRITYHAEENRYRVSVEKDGRRCGYEYAPATDDKGGEYPDLETVHRMFNDALGTKEKELYYAPLARLETLVQDRFGMNIEALYALPQR